MPVYEPEDFDKMLDPEEMARAKKEALVKRQRLEDKRQEEIDALEESLRLTEEKDGID